MFGGLEMYLNEAYLKNNQTFTVSDLYEEWEYKVVGAFLSQIYDDSYEGFKYYDYRGDLTKERFNE